MRVLLISHTCQSRAEGQPKAECLARMPGIELMVLTPQRFNHYGVWREAENPVDPKFHFVANKVMWPWLGPAQNYLHWYPGLGKILRTFRPDVVDLWQEPWALVSAQACWLRNRILPHAKIVVESEQNIFKKWPAPFSWIESYTIRNADHAVGRSGEVIDVLRAKGYHGPVETVGNAVDTELFRPLDRDACRKALGVSGFVAGYAGRLVERKGLVDMIEALRFCPPDVQFLFVGSGSMSSALEKRAKELGKGTQVKFLKNRGLEELPEIMNALDALILPSWTVPTWKEQFGRVIIEAHACGIPVIGSDSGAIPEVIGNGGVIYPERNHEALANCICRLREDPSFRERLGELGRAQVKARFTWPKVAEQMRQIYDKCLVNGGEQMRRQKVLFFDHTAAMSGGEVALLNLVTNLTQQIEPVVVLGEDGTLRERLTAAGVETHVLPLAREVAHARKDTLTKSSLLKVGAVFATMCYAFKLCSFIKKSGAALVHTNSLKADVIGGIAARLAGVPLIWHIRDRIADDYLPPAVVRAFRWLCGFLPNRIIVNSEATRDTVAPWATVVYEGIVERPAASKNDSDAKPLIGLVGRISPWKGQHIFVRAAAEVHRAFPDARFQIIGSAMFGEEKYEHDVRALVNSLGLDQRVEFTGFRDDVFTLIDRLDIVVHASTVGEPFGQVIAEGMMAGKPVVATRGGGVPEIVVDGETGILVPMADAGAMAGAIKELLADTDRAKSMGEAGRKRVCLHFNLDLAVRRVEHVYKELWAARQSSGALAARLPLPVAD
jgi:glycosyltransferase involved in cell wall biosynthesis